MTWCYLSKHTTVGWRHCFRKRETEQSKHTITMRANSATPDCDLNHRGFRLYEYRSTIATSLRSSVTTGGRKFSIFVVVISLLISKCGRYHVKRNANRYILLWWSFYFLKCHSTTLHPAGKKQSKQWMTSVRDVFVIFQRWLMFLFNFLFRVFR